MKSTTARTDIHREGAFIPTDYAHVLTFEAPTGFEPGYHNDCVRDHAVRDQHGSIVANGTHSSSTCCLTVIRDSSVKRFGTLGFKCAVCGAHYKAGDVWMHVPTGEHITLGHTCVDKYSMFANRSEYLAWKAADRKKRSEAIKTKARINRVALFLADHDGLADALKTDHRISRDLVSNLDRYGSLSEAQIALAFKLATQKAEAVQARAAEVHVPAPTGRVSFEGTVVGVKYVPGFTFRSPSVCKIIVKVEVSEGVWCCYLTAPAGLTGELKGSKVKLTATLTPGREAHFAFGSRPVGQTI